ncbi:MAG: CocE/NonD family hydrolase [Archangium sp.]|nr:CocE/NonD family hydrolase [Archangium sp.]
MKKLLVVLAIVVGLLLISGVVLSALDDAPPAKVSRPTVAMSDGTKLAVDVVLPERGGPFPIVLMQTRYWRSFALKVPEKPSRVPKGPREPIVEALVRAGYGVVVADVRGTGASEGTWPHPFGEQEARDGAELIEWVSKQPFCNGRVGATGLSYEGTTALLTAATKHPALKAVLARDLEWDLVDELVAPGGVRNLAFPEAWGRTVKSLDRGQPPELFPASARWLIENVHPVDGDGDGSRLGALQSARAVADVAEAVKQVHAPMDPFGVGGPPASSLGPSSREALSKTTAVVSLWGSWFDGATADAVLRASAFMPLQQAVIGPWEHEGHATASPFGGTTDATVELSSIVAFFDRHLKTDTNEPQSRRWWLAGAERWESGTAWPETHEVAHGFRFEAPTLDVDFAATTGVKNRWMTGMAQSVVYEDRRQAKGTLRAVEAVRATPLRFFGAPQVTCEVALDGPEAALHVYLEEVGVDGRVTLLTEGVQRVKSGPVSFPLRALAAELPVGGRLQLAIAGADSPTFERVPAEGSRRITLKAPCTLELPER